MLRDRDPEVITNCVLSLNEMLYDEGGMAVNKNISMCHYLCCCLLTYIPCSLSSVKQDPTVQRMGAVCGARGVAEISS